MSACVCVAVLAGAGACGRGSDPASAQEAAGGQAPVFTPVDAETVARQATAPMERYGGVLPCADCSGIRTELTLYKDPLTMEPRAYQMVETYLGTEGGGADSGRTVTTNGTWLETTGVPGDSIAPVVRLDGGGEPERMTAFERLNTQELRLLDRQGARIDSMLNYSLIRIPDLTLPSPSGSGGAPAAAPALSLPMAMVTDRAAGWPVTLTVGQQLAARLAVDPSGARWTLRTGSDGGIVKLEGPATTDGAGADAVEVFTLTAVKPGQSELTFDLTKAGDAAPLRSASYPVTVQ